MTEPTFSLPIARGLAFAALAGFGALHWMALLEPAEPGRALSVLLAAALAPVGLLAAARLGGRARTAAAAAVAVPVAALGLLAGGVADEYLRPDEWGTLAAAIGRGVESLPGVRVPYRGVDETIRLVIGIGGTLLVCAAALVAFWPRRRGTGYPAVALGLLVALYAIPVVVRSFENEFLRGAALALLVVAFLRLEKLRPSDAGAAGIVVTGVAVLALMMAPALDRDAPWWDYERWAFAAVSARSTAFGWDHDYGPLDWPRDGRELLRVRSRRPLYWKAANLTEFDGTRWVHGKPSGRLTEPDNPETLRRGRQRIRVTIRNLTSETFVTAGYAERVDSTVDDRSRGDGTWTAGGRLRLGDAYRATVYEPDATQQMRQRRPPPVGRSDDRMTTLVLPVSGRPGQIGTPKDVVTFPAFGDRFDKPVAREARGSLDTDADATDPARALDLGPYRRTWRLAQQLKGEAKTQEDLVQSVLAYVRRGFRYTETPRPAARNLDGFLFDAKAGYCQQFSGAMALLLRMTGVPARVATGFTPGSLDRDTGEWVVRDLDAHSWVEVWYPGLGWETFDPTPAASPARSQPNEGGTGGGPSGGGAPSLGGDLPADPGRRGPAPEPGSPWGRIALVAVAAVALLAATVLWVRRRRRAAAPIAALALGELERALRRTRRHPGAGATLRSLEAAFARSPAAAGYVRAIRNMRYAHAADPPTRAQRRALRGELARGAGLAGRLRAWWALPPLAR